MNYPDGRRRHLVSRVPLRRAAAAFAVVGLALAASGCAQSMSEFAQTGTVASTKPVSLDPTDPQAVASVTRPAVLVDEKTVPIAPRQTARTTAPMEIAPPAAEVAKAEQPDAGIAPAAINLNDVPEQPKSKLLTPAQKAKVIAELEALAKKQSAQLDRAKKSTACAADKKVDPAARLASATGDGGC